MTTIYATAIDQVLVATILPRIASNNRNTVKMHVDFNSAWVGYAKSAVFFTSIDPTRYEVVLTAAGECIIPHEVLAERCILYIGVKGVKSSTAEIKTSMLMQYNVQPGAPSMVVSPPTPDVYQQLLTENSILKSRLNTLETGSTVEGSEIMGIRTDADGVNHDSAADAVVSQVLSVREGTMKKNLIDMYALSAGWLQTTGEFALSHQQTTYYRWEYTSDYIPVTPGLPYMLSIVYDKSVAGWCCVCTYDKDKNFISRMFVNEHTDIEYRKRFTFSEGVSFVRVSYRSYGTAKIKFEQSTYATRIETETFEGNLLDVCPLMFDGFIVESGSIFPQTEEGYAGEGEPALKEKYSRHIPVKAGEKYTVYHIADKWGWIAIGVYDADGKGIKRFTSSDTKHEFTIPEGAQTMIMCARTHYLKDFALFKNAETACDGQRLRENYFDLLTASDQIAGLNYSPVKSIAHRGFSTIAPENTLSAFRLAKKNGFKYVECDVSFTSDDVAVLLHDSTIDRTSNGTGNIANMTFESVRALDFGSWKSEEYAGEKIPTFEEFIVLCKHIGVHPYIELKSGTANQIKSLVDTVKRHGMKNEVTWISFDSASLAALMTADKTARLGYVADTVSATTIDTVRNKLQSGFNEVFIDCAHSNATADVVQLCIDADIPLEAWTVNNKSAMLALDPYISGVTSDNLIASKVFHNNEML
jgi:glycerophosphoryl diester phosphodiesterase